MLLGCAGFTATTIEARDPAITSPSDGAGASAVPYHNVNESFVKRTFSQAIADPGGAFPFWLAAEPKRLIVSRAATRSGASNPSVNC